VRLIYLFPMRVASSSWCLGLAIAFVSSTTGCDSSDDGGGGEGGGVSNANVSFHEHVEPLIQRSCLSCHMPGLIGGFSLEKYDEAKPLAGLIAKKTAAREMPPFLAQDTDECQVARPFVDDLRLSDDEIAMLQAWADNGAPEGDPAKAPPPYEAKLPGLANAELELEAEEPGLVDGTSDVFECVVYDPALTETRFIDGIHILAGNPQIAHHALIFRSSRQDAVELAGGGTRFPCFGSPPGELMHAWAPGGLPLELPDTVGMELGADDVIIVQMHYHPTGVAAEDSSTIQLRFTDEAPLYAYQVALIGNSSSASDGLLPGDGDSGLPEFRIPANAVGHVEEMVQPVDPSVVPISIPILLVATHMHYVGVDMRFWIERPSPDGSEPADECLLHTPKWDFNWQRGYMYDTPISELPYASPGDTLHMRCVYDNRLENPFVQEALDDLGMSAPQDVRLGETTLDEMCLVAVGILVPNF